MIGEPCGFGAGALLLALVIGVSGASGASQPSPSRLVGSIGERPVRTVARVSGRVLGFAQNRRYLAWLLHGPAGSGGIGGVGTVVVEDLRSGARTRLPAHPGEAGAVVACFDPRGLALAGGRAYWEQLCASQNTTDATLVSASVHDVELRGLGSEEVGSVTPSPDRLQPPVSDGTSVYFWSGSEPDFLGPIVRFDGAKRRTFSSPLPAPAALAAGGGRFARAIHDYDEASSPAWSPDGKQIAYVRHDRELWLVNADGTDPHRIADRGLNPDWSPDGTRLAYGGPGNTVVVANADGSDPRVVTSGGDPAWAPDGRQLVITDQGAIWTVALDGSDRRLVIPNGTAPDWSPDGTQLVFARGQFHSDVVIANADGSNQRTLITGNLATASPSWSPDGTEIAFTGCGYETDPNIENVCEIRPDGSGEQALATGADEVRSAYEPAWGPTPGQLAFVKVDPLTGDGDPHLVLWPQKRQVTTAPPATPIVVQTQSGRTVAQIEPGGRVVALAVSTRVAAALVQEAGGGWAIEIYQPRRRAVPLADTPQNELAVDDTTLVFQVGDRIETLDARQGSPRPLATTTSRAIGLSIVGNRVAWAENHRSSARIQTLRLR